MARELGDYAAVARLSAAAEQASEPRYFGDHNEMFGWWGGLNEAYPRGQQSAQMMVNQVGEVGDWRRAFEAPHMDKFTAPTVEGIDFPSLGVDQAWNDTSSGTLHVGTYPMTPDRRGVETSWRVTNLPNATDVVILVDGQPFRAVRRRGAKYDPDRYNDGHSPVSDLHRLPRDGSPEQCGEAATNPRRSRRSSVRSTTGWERRGSRARRQSRSAF